MRATGNQGLTQSLIPVTTKTVSIKPSPVAEYSSTKLPAHRQSLGDALSNKQFRKVTTNTNPNPKIYDECVGYTEMSVAKKTT